MAELGEVKVTGTKPTMKPEVSGWYYDLQKNPIKSPLTTVSLHYNKKFDGQGTNGWSNLVEGETDKDGYSTDYLCTSILTEDFTVAVNNHWSDFGGDPISELWDRAKPLAPYSKVLGDTIQRIAASDTQEHEGTVSSLLSRGIQWLARENTVDKITDYLNRKLIVQGTRFSYYNGTDISFGSLGMKFTIFPTWDSDGNLYTVNNQVNKLYPYVIGKFVKNDLLSKEIPELKEYIGWQIQPGGYTPKPENLDKIQEGTLKLKIGILYSIPNLLISDAQFTYSKQAIKLPTQNNIMGAEGENVETIITPMSCDVSLIFRPATKFSDDALKQFVTGVGREEDLKYLNINLKNKLKNV